MTPSSRYAVARSRPDDHGFEVIGTDGDGAGAGVAVVAASEGDQVAVQGFALLRCQGLKRPQRRAIIRAKEADVFLRGAETEDRRAAVTGAGGSAGAEEGTLVGPAPPADRGLQARGWGEITREEAERFADEAVRRPAGQRDPPAGTADARQFRGGAPVVRGKHDPVNGSHGIE